MKRLKISLFVFLLSIGMIIAGCGNSENTASEGGEASKVRIGYFPNLTHISTIVALEKGYFEEELGEDIEIVTQTFPDGSAFMEAMSTGNIDVGTVGPTPVINNFIKNPAHQILAGAVNAGAVLVVREDAGIESVEDLAGKRVAIPTIGSTQDIMLMKALKDAGLDVKTSGGTVETMKQAPADTATLFLQKDVDAAATQEPWGVNLEANANAKVLLDANEFAWGEESTNTVFVGTNKFTEANPELTKKILAAHVKSINFINENKEEAIDLFISHIKEITGKELSLDEVTKAMERTIPTYELNEDVLNEMAKISKDAGYITSDDIDGLVNKEFLNEAVK
ncbi:MAG: ABC transporter substrate-binding protein [Bacillus sp. (in: firmicutes)]